MGVYVALTDSLKLMIEHYRKTMDRDKFDHWMESVYNGIQFYKEQFAKIPEGKNRAFNVHRFLDQVKGEEAKENPKGWEQISCRKGCSACCRKTVILTDDEADLLVEHCREEKIEIDVDYLKRQANFDGSSDEYFDRGELANCVFLKNNECSVYEHRPAACRKFFVVSDPKNCDGPSGNEIAAHISLNLELVACGAMDIDHKRVGDMPDQLLKRIEGGKGGSISAAKRVSPLSIDGRP